MWIIEDIEFMILVFIIVMILWLNCFEGNWNVRCPEENVCTVSVIHAEQVRVSFIRSKKGALCKIYDTAKLL